MPCHFVSCKFMPWLFKCFNWGMLNSLKQYELAFFGTAASWRVIAIFPWRTFNLFMLSPVFTIQSVSKPFNVLQSLVVEAWLWVAYWCSQRIGGSGHECHRVARTAFSHGFELDWCLGNGSESWQRLALVPVVWLFVHLFKMVPNESGQKIVYCRSHPILGHATPIPLDRCCAGWKTGPCWAQCFVQLTRRLVIATSQESDRQAWAVKGSRFMRTRCKVLEVESCHCHVAHVLKPEVCIRNLWLQDGPRRAVPIFVSIRLHFFLCVCVWYAYVGLCHKVV